MAIDLLLLLRAYASGVFPMSDARDDPDVFWIEARRRGILPLAGFHLSRSLARGVRADRFRVTADAAFAEVIRRCWEPTPDRPESWINEEIEAACPALHARGDVPRTARW